MSNEKHNIGWRIKTGFALFVISLGWPILIPVLPLLKVPASATAAIGGVMLVSAEVLLIVAAAISGKDGFAFIKQTVLGFLKSCGPPAEVSHTRYNIGLILFLVPLIFGWLSPYVSHYFPVIDSKPVLTAMVLDLILFVSLFVLGGSFWEKLRSLFRSDA